MNDEPREDANGEDVPTPEPDAEPTADTEGMGDSPAPAEDGE